MQVMQNYDIADAILQGIQSGAMARDDCIDSLRYVLGDKQKDEVIRDVEIRVVDDQIKIDERRFNKEEALKSLGKIEVRND